MLGQKQTVFTDLDDTIFDRRQFVHDYFDMLSGLGFTPEQILTAYETREVHPRTGYAGPEAHLSKLQELFPHGSFNMEQALQMVEHFFSPDNPTAKDYVFPEARQLLESAELHSRFRLRLITVGLPSFQARKVREANVAQYFDDEPIYVPTDQIKSEVLGEYVDPDEEFVLIDDKTEECEAARARFGTRVRAIQVSSRRQEFLTEVGRELGLSFPQTETNQGLARK